jgi:uncharacterized protein (TIGR00251 family)
MNAPSRWPCVLVADHGTLLLVSVMPNAKRTEAVGLHDGMLRVRLAAPALEGRANDALIEWLASQLKLPKRAIELRHGASARRKRLAIDVPAERVLAWLETLGLQSG